MEEKRVTVRLKGLLVKLEEEEIKGCKNLSDKIRFFLERGMSSGEGVDFSKLDDVLGALGELSREMRAIGRNLNQLVRSFHRGDFSSKEEVSLLVASCEKVMREAYAELNNVKGLYRK